MKASTPVADFLAHRRIAFVGVSRNGSDFSRHLFRDWRARGYDLVPVHPSAREVDGVPCYGRVRDVPGGVEAAFLMTPPAATEAVVADCAAAGVREIWMHRGAGRGAVSPRAVDFCREQGMTVIPGACPYMFLRGTAWFHGVHGLVLRLLGRRPS
jgi:hypothetical protein